MKLKVLTMILASINVFSLFGQQQTTDKINTSKGPLLVKPIEHATFVLTWNESTIYVDPVGGAEAFKSINKPDLILITDIHGDHFDLKTLEAINSPNTKIITPQAVADKLPASLKSNLVVLKNGEQTTASNIDITAIPMYNLPESSTAFHPKGRGNGYVLTIADKKIYISGDTQNIPEMRDLKGIDAAFICMNLPYTMDINEAAKAVLTFKPKVVYPFHYRGKDGLSDVNKFKELVNSSDKNIEVKLLKWY